jgi:hypothetical protein
MAGIRDQESGIRNQESGIRNQKFMGASRRGRRQNHATPNILAAAKPPVTSSDP